MRSVYSRIPVSARPRDNSAPGDTAFLCVCLAFGLSLALLIFRIAALV